MTFGVGSITCHAQIDCADFTLFGLGYPSMFTILVLTLDTYTVDTDTTCTDTLGTEEIFTCFTIFKLFELQSTIRTWTCVLAWWHLGQWY